MKRYFRVMDALEGDWVLFGSHAVPREGEYLVAEGGQVSALCPTSFEKYEGIEYAVVPALDKMLDDGLIVEVPEDIRDLDWRLQARIAVLEGAIGELEEKLEELEPKMHERRFLFLTEEARNARHIFGELKPMMDGLCAELHEVRLEMEKEVVEPLYLMALEYRSVSSLRVDDIIERAVEQGFARGGYEHLEVEHDALLHG